MHDFFALYLSTFSIAQRVNHTIHNNKDLVYLHRLDAVGLNSQK
jgi:hypothetical protein